MKRLQEIGFQKVGYWTLDNNRLIFKIHEVIHSSNVLYAFVSSDTVFYIGKTTQTLPKRMMGYKNPSPTQSTNIRNHSNIRNLLAYIDRVEIYALPDTGLLQFGQFQINLAAALEDNLIKVLMPAWNGRVGSP